MVKRRWMMGDNALESMPQTMALGVALALAELERRGIDPRPALAEARLEHNAISTAGDHIPQTQYAAFLEAAARDAQDPFFGLTVGGLIDPRDLGALSYVAIASETLEEAVTNLKRYLRLISQSETIDVTIAGDHAIITSTPVQTRVPVDRHAAEAGAWFFVRFCRHLTGLDITPCEARFMHDYSGDAAHHTALFGCPVLFGQPRQQMFFRRGDFSAGIETADSRLHQILRGHCDGLMEKTEQFTPEQISVVRRCIADRLPQQNARAKVVASDLGMSERSLSRRLHEHGTNFGALKDALCLDLSHDLMRDPDKGLGQIAYLLGYSSQSAFNAFYKRMTGRTPSDARKDMAKSAPSSLRG